jgi:hypothetical protein
MSTIGFCDGCERTRSTIIRHGIDIHSGRPRFLCAECRGIEPKADFTDEEYAHVQTAVAALMAQE